ncbi:DNA-3-methyladenine glycosylase [Gloeocapsopsis sp. IPPAS B-1203]|uniref:DNA-3-methyladenine glycosylase family protein n=1 Tax=Gloeocapsopsis sp. IPPAS B-1203 TaxID=2049454 RepID=UPI000C18FDA5|nr:DNA-3-methyladenine glycosylase [Gloeocapsopsis sp. IPPAS B-1203]PIG92964.1 Fe-S cluster assembly protein HesB [Gloeocapsopsis sp. IPPAS B-1203]
MINSQKLVYLNYQIATTALKQSDAILASIIEQVGDCTLAQEQQTGDLLSSLCEAIIYQQLSVKAASIIHQRFLELYSELSAQSILDTSDETLRNAGISRPKIAYLKGLAQKNLDGLPTLNDLETMDDESIIQTLTQVKGIGRWTAEMVLIFRLHRWDVLPADDLGIRAAIYKAYNLPDLPNKKAVNQLGQVWQPYRTVASWYLWQSLKLKT